MNQPHIVYLDLETLPNLREILKVFPSLSNYPGRTMKASITTIICAGYKILGEKETHCISAWDFKTRWNKNVNDDYAVCKAISKILQRADMVITHNGKKFDWKFLQTRLMYHKLPLLPENIKHVDTCQVGRKKLLLYSNSLDAMSEFLGTGKKMENGGWQLWVDTHDKVPKAMKTMSEYCMKDVELLEKDYLRLRPLSKTVNHSLFTTRTYKSCNHCASTRLMKWGTCTTNTKILQRYRCKDCGSTGTPKQDKKGLWS